jgi:hypothetical protein
MKKQIIVLCALFVTVSANCSMFSRLKQSAQDKLEQARAAAKTSLYQAKDTLKSAASKVKSTVLGGAQKFKDKMYALKAYAQGASAKEAAQKDYNLISEYVDNLSPANKAWVRGLEGKLQKGIPLTSAERNRLEQAIMTDLYSEEMF